MTIKCLMGGCPRLFTDEEIKTYIDGDTFYKYRRFKLAQLKFNNLNKNYVNCPYPDCEDILEYDQVIHEDPMIECENKHQFCAKCKSVGWHRGTCDNVKYY
jgi:hypothetical protein